MALSSTLRDQTRLPTPPKEASDDINVRKAVDDALEYLNVSLTSSKELCADRSGETAMSQANTPPPSSPLAEKPLEEISSSQRTKRLRFSSETSFCEATPKPLLPSKLQTPAKSILKPFDQSAYPYLPSVDQPTSSASCDQPQDYVSMLDSALESLAEENWASRRDAYSSISTAMKLYPEHPAFKSLITTISSLEPFLQRDLDTRSAETLTYRQLKLQALYLTIALIRRSSPLPDCPNDLSFSNKFLIFLVDHCIENVGCTSIDKELQRNYLNVLALEEIHSRGISNERAARCLKALNSIPEMHPGKSVVQLRLRIIDQITQHHPNPAVDEISGIVHHIMYGFCSQFAANRERAIATAENFGISIGHRNRVAQAFRAWLELTDENDKSYFSHFEDYLLILLRKSSRETASSYSHHVPRIWGTIMLLIRGDQSGLYSCLMRSSWMKIIERCFNSSDAELNLYAWTAWNRTIFAAQKLLVKHNRVLKKICSPILGCLRRANLSEDKLKVKHAVHQSLGLILYYTFTQKLEAAKIKHCWKTIIGGYSEAILKDEVDDLYHFGQSLCSMFSDSTLKFRKADRGLEVSEEPLDAHEIPKLDPLWIRNNVSTIFKSIGPLLQQQQPPQHHIVFVKPVWQSLMKGIAHAGEKEIIASAASRLAIAEISKFLNDLWEPSERRINIDPNHSPIPPEDLTALMKISAHTLGGTLWGQDFVLPTDTDLYKVASSSPGSLASDSNLQRSGSPLSLNLRRLSEPSSDVVVTPSLRMDVMQIIRICVEAKSTRSSKIDLIWRCAITLSTPKSPNQRLIIPIIWQSLALQLQSVLLEREEANKDLFHPPQCRKVLQVLGAGLALPDRKSVGVGRNLLDTLADLIIISHGETFFVAWVAEPWLQTLEASAPSNRNTVLSYLSSLLSLNIPIPRNESLETARKSVERKNDGQSCDISDPWPTSLCKIIGSFLIISYDNLEVTETSTVYSFLSSIRDYLESAQSSDLKRDAALLLSEILPGFLFWLEDRKEKLIRFLDRGYDLQQPVRDIFISILNHANSACLSSNPAQVTPAISELFVAAFKSRHKSIANEAVKAWNTMHDARATLEYPQRLEMILERLSKYIKVQRGMPFKDNMQAEIEVDESEDDHVLFPWLRRDNSQGADDLRQTSRKLKSLLSRHAHGPRSCQTSPPPDPVVPLRSHEDSKLSQYLPFDDSQPFLVTTESPPKCPKESMESQLTEHQREVTSKQHEEAERFSDTVSSPSERADRTSTRRSRHQEDKNLKEPVTTVAHQEPLQGIASRANISVVKSSPSRKISSDATEQDQVLEGRLNSNEEHPEVVTKEYHPEADQNARAASRPALFSSKSSGIFVDASSGIEAEPALDVNHARGGQTFKTLSGVRSGPLQDMSLNTSYASRDMGVDTGKDNAQQPDSPDCIEDSFSYANDPAIAEQTLKSIVAPTPQNETTVNQYGGNVPLEFSQSSVDNSQNDSQLEIPSSASQQSSQKRGRKRKSTFKFTRTKKRKTQSNSKAGSEIWPLPGSNFHQEAADDPDATIIVEPPDENSPSLQVVLENLGILEHRPETPLSNFQRANSRCKRSVTVESSQSVYESIENQAPSRRRRKQERPPRSSQTSSSQNSQSLNSSPPDSAFPREISEPASPFMDPTLVVDRLRLLISDVKGLEFGSSNENVGAELLELSEQLQREIRAAMTCTKEK